MVFVKLMQSIALETHLHAVNFEKTYPDGLKSLISSLSIEKIGELANLYISKMTNSLSQEVSSACSHPLLQQPCQILTDSKNYFTPPAEKPWSFSNLILTKLGLGDVEPTPPTITPFFEALQAEAASLPSNLYNTLASYPYSAALILGISAFQLRSKGKLSGATTLATLSIGRALVARYGVFNTMTAYGILNSYRSKGLLGGTVDTAKVIGGRLAFEGLYQLAYFMLGPYAGTFLITAFLTTQFTDKVKKAYRGPSESAPKEMKELDPKRRITLIPIPTS